MFVSALTFEISQERTHVNSPRVSEFFVVALVFTVVCFAIP